MIYVDNAATTRLSTTALNAMLPYLTDTFGNPSSIHSAGQQAARALREARKTIADCIGCEPEEIIFTSGGSEADNQAVFSAAAWGKAYGKTHFITTAIEHHAVLRPLEELQRLGFSVDVVPVMENGIVCAEQIAEKIRPDTCLVTVMSANNEIGTVQPVTEIGSMCSKAGVLFHTDAVQALGMLPVDFRNDRTDMLSGSAHKFHGPKGTGILVVRKGCPIFPRIFGGGQEQRRRAGTENVAGIVGMAAALSEVIANQEESRKRVVSLRDELLTGLLARIPGCYLNGDSTRRLPGNVSLCFDGIEGEALVLQLDLQGVCASSGSACTAGQLEPSHVLLAIGRSERLAKSALRIAIGDENSAEEIQQLLHIIPETVQKIRALSRK